MRVFCGPELSELKLGIALRKQRTTGGGGSGALLRTVLKRRLIRLQEGCDEGTTVKVFAM